jgi:uncharacterized lipoprotein YmbA
MLILAANRTKHLELLMRKYLLIAAASALLAGCQSQPREVYPQLPEGATKCERLLHFARSKAILFANDVQKLVVVNAIRDNKCI